MMATLPHAHPDVTDQLTLADHELYRALDLLHAATRHVLAGHATSASLELSMAQAAMAEADWRVSQACRVVDPTDELTDEPTDEPATMHPAAVLVGGRLPAHVPGAYPFLKCCGGTVDLVDGLYTEAEARAAYGDR